MSFDETGFNRRADSTSLKTRYFGIVSNRRWRSFLSMDFCAEFLSNVILVSNTECKVETMIDVSVVLHSGSIWTTWQKSSSSSISMLSAVECISYSTIVQYLYSIVLGVLRSPSVFLYFLFPHSPDQRIQAAVWDHDSLEPSCKNCWQWSWKLLDST